MGAAAGQWAPWNPTETDRTPKFPIPHWGPPYFGGFRPNYLIYYAPDAPLPDTQMEKAGECETTDHTMGRRGTPRGATEPDGSPNFGYSAPESAKIWRIRSKFSNIFLRPTPPFPNTQMGKVAEGETTGPNKVTRRNTTERYGT